MNRRHPLISEYKGFEISFDIEKESFIVEGYDDRKEKRSYAAAKKYINDFIKANNVFGEFEIIKLPTERYYDEVDKHPVRVVGMHSNGNFLCIKSDGTKFQLQGDYIYDLDKYCFPEDLEECGYDPKVMEALDKERDAIRIKEREEEAKLPQPITAKMKQLKEECKHLWANQK